METGITPWGSWPIKPAMLWDEKILVAFTASNQNDDSGILRFQAERHARQQLRDKWTGRPGYLDR